MNKREAMRMLKMGAADAMEQRWAMGEIERLRAILGPLLDASDSETGAFRRYADGCGVALCSDDGPCRVTGKLWTLAELRKAAEATKENT